MAGIETGARAAPSQTELVIGLVGAVGIDLGNFVDELAYVLGKFDYQVHDLHLTDQLRRLDWEVKLKQDPYDERVWSYMSAGNALREKWQTPEAFALLGINAITLTRKEIGGDSTVPLDRHAYILRSLKRPEEVKLLRQVYGSRFVLYSIYSPEKVRRRYLKRRIAHSRALPCDPKPVYNAKKLIRRDHREATDYGQGVQATFHLGDFFIDARSQVKNQLQRTLEILFGHPRITPSRDEFGMFQAVAASRRSAELGRQVGAAICTPDGDVIALGTNEVPKAGGGLYWPGDKGDAREFTQRRDGSDKRKGQIATRIARDLAGREWLAEGISQKEVEARLRETDIGDLIEFIRAVHAEMAALMDAARRGIAVYDAVLYVTTFPCHHCARHIVASGIQRVVYVAPYPKSLAGGLHDDSIHVDPRRKRTQRKVVFEPFVGTGPQRYLQLFDMPRRKRKSGKVVKFKRSKAVPRFSDLEPNELLTPLLPYIRRERRALDLLQEVQEEFGPSMTTTAE